MAIDAVRTYLKQWNRDQDILEFDQSSATVALAAEALGIEPGRIAKTLAFRSEDGAVIVVAAGDAKIDNSKFKSTFGFKARMLSAEDTLEQTGHAVGGVCPFALVESVPVYLDDSLKRFETVYPACGSSNSAIELNCEELHMMSAAKGWVDVCKL
ncbi:MAG: hypothetical protein PWQ12_160 [Clostridiales bacterium]|jgi:prolyl-tRNA editing enzyme YbaK/EbsC (Cys-tRNA(Pro) deacylase)|nr:hypothetical protein [Clostridiales bacterium]